MNRVGRYEIIGRLGRGGMSTVYKARAPVTERIVALKILRPKNDIFVDLVGWDRLREVFFAEAQIMGGISHEHVAKVIDCDEAVEGPFIVLEYFAHSLGALIGEAYRVEQTTRVISPRRSCFYLDQVLRGLERLHFAGIVHRDIKPYNLLLTNDDRVKIIDFGLSRVRGEEKMAIPGMQIGSPYFTAPEQEQWPERADRRADLYSVGVLMYRLLTGRLVQTDEDGILPPSRFNAELDPAWDAFLARSLATDPAARFGDAEEMRGALMALYRDWAASSRRACASPVNAPPAQIDIGPPRREAKRILQRDIAAELDLDSLFRPIRWCRHPLEVVDTMVLHDPLTGLIWQRAGSGFVLNWRQAAEYIEHLNGEGWQGRTGWRLPTTAELRTIMQAPTVHRDFCLDRHFLPTLHWLWSCDHCTAKQAWMADISESFFARLDIDGHASVCAVWSKNG